MLIALVLATIAAVLVVAAAGVLCLGHVANRLDRLEAEVAALRSVGVAADMAAARGVSIADAQRAVNLATAAPVSDLAARARRRRSMKS